MFNSNGVFVCPCDNCAAFREASRRYHERKHNKPMTREARIEEIERKRDAVLAECNPNLPTYEAK